MIDGLTYSATSYYQLDLVCYDLNLRIDMKNRSGAGGTTGNFRSGSYTFTGLNSGSYYRFYAEARYNSFGTIVRIPASSYESFQTDEMMPEKPTFSILDTNGRTIDARVYTGASTGSVDIDYSWVSGSFNKTINVGSNTYADFSFTVPEYSTLYEMRGMATNPSGGSAIWGNWFTFASEPEPIVVGTPTVTLSNYKSNAITVNWTSASNAWYYQVQYRLSPSGTWFDSATSQSDNLHEVTGLSPVTDYQFRVRGYQGSTYGSYSSVMTGRTLTNIPNDFTWTYSKVTNGTYNLTANEWNALTSKINQWRAYKGLLNYSFTTATAGGIFYAYMFNEARTAISPMNPSVALPAAVASGGDVTAAALNGLRDSLNSIT